MTKKKRVMNFEEAIKELRKGKKIKDVDWVDGHYLYKEYSKIVHEDGEPFELGREILDTRWEIYDETIKRKDKLDKIIEKCYNFFVSPRHQDFKGFWERTEYDELKIELEELQ